MPNPKRDPAIRALEDIGWFSTAVTSRALRHYQLLAARAIVRSVLERQGRTFTVMMARQMGKNELSAQLEAYLLYLHQQFGGTIVKAAPTFKPQLITSKMRLERTLARIADRRHGWRSRFGYIVELGEAAIHFLSAEDSSNVVGATADLLLEMDEAQDISEDKYARDFRPMASTANTTTVLYGTAWSNDTMLARQRAVNLRDDPGAHFEFAWPVLGDINPAYAAFVQAEIRRLGEDHPIIRTQYRLETVDAAGRLFNAEQLALLQGRHARCEAPPPDGAAIYVAGVDVAGEGEAVPDAAARDRAPRKDSTVVTIARVSHPPELLGEPLIEVVQHHWWTGRDHSTQYTGLLELLRSRWRCQAVVVDGTGVGAGVASWLARSMGDRVEPLHFSRPVKSELGYELLAAVNAGRLRMYVSDGSPESSEFWLEARACRYAIHANNALNFFVDERDGHDDFVMSLALCVRAAGHALPEPASAIIPARPLYPWSRF